MSAPPLPGPSGPCNSAPGFPYTIRQARAADTDPLIELMLALQDHLEANNPELWRMKAEARSQLGGQIRARLAADRGCALVAEYLEKGIVGVIFGRIAINKRYVPARTGIIDQVFVEENHRRAGLGSRLVAALCRFFAKQDVKDLSLRYVVGNQEAAGFWAALGFKPRILTVGANRQLLESHLHRHSSS